MDGNATTFEPTTPFSEDTNSTISISNGTIGIPTGSKSLIDAFFVREYRNACLGFYQTQLWPCFDGSTYALSMVAVILACFGIIGNVIVFVKIVSDKKLHSDIFIALACVIVSDSAALISYSVSGYIAEVIVVFDATLAVNLVFIICTAMWSILNALLLTVVRYRLQRESDSKRMATKIIVSNVVFFITGLGLGIAFVTPLFLNIQSTNYTGTLEYQRIVTDFSASHLYLRLAVASCPLIPSLILHIIRLRIRNNFFYVRKRISVIITIMLTIFNLACLQEIVLISVYLIWGADLPDWLKKLTTSSEFRIFRVNPLPWIINFSIKPFLLFLITPPMIWLWSKICCCVF
jgi:hypothetical protein